MKSVEVSTHRQNMGAFFRTSSLRTVIAAPIVYSLMAPLLLLDAWITIYQRVCFPVFGIPLVPRRDYFVIDGHRLPYLNVIEKAHCLYCSYANGLLAYVCETAARTEQYWCPSQHQHRPGRTHGRYDLFAAYGDAAGYRRRAPALRQSLQDERVRPHVPIRRAG